MKKIGNIEFQIKGIELLDSSIIGPIQPLSSTSTFQFDIHLEHRIALDDQYLMFVCNVVIFDESKEISFGSIRTNCIYEINDLQTYLPDGKKINLPSEFVSTLNSISISTTRGMMFSLYR